MIQKIIHIELRDIVNSGNLKVINQKTMVNPTYQTLAPLHLIR